MISASSAAANAAKSGQRSVNAANFGRTVATVVCWSMISDSQTRYGSGAGVPGGARHGSARAWTSYQATSLSAIDERLAGTRRLWHEERHEQNARGAAPPDQIGRASCRERVWQYV